MMRELEGGSGGGGGGGGDIGMGARSLSFPRSGKI